MDFLGTLGPRERPRSPMISPFASLNLPRPEDTGGRQVYSPEQADNEALIKVELDIISPSCPTNTSQSETLHIANVQFNNLDVVGKHLKYFY